MDKYSRYRLVMDELRRMQGRPDPVDKYDELRQDTDGIFALAIAAEVKLFRQIIEVDFTPEQDAAHPLRQRLWLENAFFKNYKEALDSDEADYMGVKPINYLEDIFTDSFRAERQKETAYLDGLGL